MAFWPQPSTEAGRAENRDHAPRSLAVLYSSATPDWNTPPHVIDRVPAEIHRYFQRKEHPMSLIATVRRLLKQEKIPFCPDATGTLLLGFPDPEGLFYGDLQVNEEDRVILIQTAPPLRAPQDKLMHMAEFVTRANQHILQGSLRVGFRSGLIVCKTSLILGKARCQPDLFYHVLASNWCEIKRWFPAMKAVIIDGLSPEEAVKMIAPGQQRSQGSIVHTNDAWDRHIGGIQHGSVN